MLTNVNIVFCSNINAAVLAGLHCIPLPTKTTNSRHIIQLIQGYTTESRLGLLENEVGVLCKEMKQNRMYGEKKFQISVMTLFIIMFSEDVLLKAF